jgi:hypothetical protein
MLNLQGNKGRVLLPPLTILAAILSSFSDSYAQLCFHYAYSPIWPSRNLASAWRMASKLLASI